MVAVLWGGRTVGDQGARPGTLDNLLGRGFDSSLGALRGRCLSGKARPRGKRSASLELVYGRETERSTDTVRGALSGEINLGLIGGKAAMQYDREVSDASLSLSLYLLFQSSMGSFALDERALSPLGQMAVRQGQESVLSTCGDRFVTRVEGGARLRLGATFHLADRSAFERFKKTIQVSALFGLISKTQQSVEEVRSFARSAVLEISGAQEGGDPAQLAALLSPAPGGPLVCGLGDLSPCSAQLDRLLAYARRPDGFQGQLAGASPGLVALRIFTGGYEEAGHFPLAVTGQDTGGLASAGWVRQILAEQGRQLRLGQRIAVLRRLPCPTKPGPRDLDGLSESVQRNLAALDQTLGICREAPTQASCEQATRATLAALERIDVDALSFSL